MAPFGPLQALAARVPLRWREVKAVGDDLRITAVVAGRDPFLGAMPAVSGADLLQTK
jgi:hypothetical protein